MITRGRWMLVILVAGSLTAAATLTYKQWNNLLGRIRNQPASVSPGGDQVSTVPPFSTKEPDRYQATRIVTTTENANGNAGSQPLSSTQKFFISRDGENRREEFNPGSDAMVVYLETPAGRFLLFPGKRIFADLNSSAESIDDSSDDSERSGVLDFSPNRLLHESSARARYQTLGTENLDGRKTTKYRVTSDDSSGTIGSGSVTLIWIDDELGLPIKSETTSAGGDRPTKVVTELRDIKQDVDARSFDLPQDYKKVDYTALRAEIMRVQSATDHAAPKSKTP